MNTVQLEFGCGQCYDDGKFQAPALRNLGPIGRDYLKEYLKNHEPYKVISVKDGKNPNKAGKGQTGDITQGIEH